MAVAVVELIDDLDRLQRDRNNIICRQNNTERQCIVGKLLTHNMNVRNNHDIVILYLRTRTFLIIERRAQIININIDRF